MSLVPTRAAALIDETLDRYIAARALRLWPNRPDFGKVGGGTRSRLRKMLSELLDEGFEPNLLASLPALTNSEGLCKRADVLLRSGKHATTGQDGKTYGATCHALVIESALADKGHALTQAQVAILRNIGTADFVRNRGAFAVGGWS